MAIIVKEAAKGNAPNTGAPGPTPAPTRPAPPDMVTNPRAPHGTGYGTNQDAGPASIEPGTTRASALAANMRASVDDDGCLDRIQKNGTRMDDSINTQLRKVAADPYPTTFGCEGAKPGPKIPGAK
jgi:hypothetical protein